MLRISKMLLLFSGVAGMFDHMMGTGVAVYIQALNANGGARGGGERVIEHTQEGLALAAYNRNDTSQIWSRTDDPIRITFTLKLG